MKFRWTKKDLANIDDIDFAIAILDERASDLNPYSFLAQKINKTRKTLQNIKR